MSWVWWYPRTNRCEIEIGASSLKERTKSPLFGWREALRISGGRPVVESRIVMSSDKIYASGKREKSKKKKMALEPGKQVTLCCYLRFLFLFPGLSKWFTPQCSLQFSILSDIHDNMWNAYLALGRQNMFCSAEWKKKKTKVQRRTDESRETRIVAEFPRCDEIVKRFMKAFMKGFTSHGPNWGPEFASATHVLSRRRAPPSPETPRGPILVLHLSLSFPLRAATSLAFSLSILESASFFIIIISVVDTSSLAWSRHSLFSPFHFSPRAPSFSSDIFHDRYFPRLRFFRDVEG